MGDLKVKKVCGFNISSVHFGVMILPYIKKEIQEERNVITILEENLETNINQILSKLSINNEEKEKMLNINWKETDIKNEKILGKLKNQIEGEENLDIIIYGSKQYINNADEIIEKINLKKNTKIINCYKFEDFSGNIKEILDKHDTIFNTSGEQKIEDVYKEYKKIS